MTRRFGRFGALLAAGLLATATAAATAHGQETGRIAGRIVDGTTGQGLTNVGVQITGTTVGTQSGVDGRFVIPAAPAGTISLTVRRLGYRAKTVTGVMVPAGGAVEQNVTLETAVVQLATTVVTAEAERGSVGDALDQQRSATGIVASISAEQMSRSPDGDASQAVQRVSGVTVQDDKTVFVRGLGERYTTTTLNGARLPSADPEKRSVPLDMFPSGLLQSISTQKTFTPDMSGDFAGAQVDIKTREFPAERTWAASLSLGANTAATGQSVLQGPRLSGDLFALGSGARAAPSALATAGDLRNLQTQGDINSAARQLRNNWTPVSGTGLPNSSFGLSLGGQDPIFGRSIGYLASANYSVSQDVHTNEVRSNPAITDGAISELERWEGRTGVTSATLSGMLNLTTFLGTHTRLSLDNTYTRTADNEASQDEGFTFFYLAPARRSTQRYVERAVRSNQLRGEHVIGDSRQLDWNLTSSGVSRLEPDRTDLVYVEFQSPTGSYFGYPASDPQAGRRTFGDLSENSYSSAVNFSQSFGDVSRPFNVKTGALLRYTSRDALNNQFSVYADQLPAGAERLSAEEIYARFAVEGSGGTLRISGANEAGSYEARELLSAGYAMIEIPFGERLRATVGARVENAAVDVDSDITSGRQISANLDNTDVLPSLVLNFRATENHTFRASVTQTLARPEYRELAPIQYLEVIGNNITRGNENLQRSLIRNADLKWEFYPTDGELFSVGVFAKQFDDPIERVDVASGGPSFVTFVNSESAFNVGLELEARKGLGSFLEAAEAFDVFANVTLMRSDISIGEGVSSNTNSSRPMIGQAPYVVNTGVNYRLPFAGASATLLYNVVGKRIWAAGTIPYPDIYEMPRNMLDFSLRFPAFGNTTVRFDARNLMNAPYVLEQGPLVRERYETGRTFSLGLSWRP